MRHSPQSGEDTSGYLTNNVKIVIEANAVTTSETIPRITEDELLKVHEKISDKKTSGPDGILKTSVQVGIRTRPDMFLEFMQKCLDEGMFPKRSNIVWFYHQKKQTIQRSDLISSNMPQ